MSLKKLKATKLQEPPRYLFYGGEGVGKTTLAAHAPSPIFMDIEGGSGHLEVVRYPFNDVGTRPSSLAQVYAGIQLLGEEKHDYKTLVIDTVDALEPLVWQHVVDRESKNGGRKLNSIEDFGYGRGYTAATEEWRVFLARLEGLRAKGMSFILLGHAQVKAFRNPMGDDYDQYKLRLHEKASGLLKESVDVVGFIAYEGGAKKDGNRSKGFSTGRRLAYLERTAAFDAKKRFDLPAFVELAPGDPWHHFAGGSTEEAASIRDAISTMLKDIKDSTLTKRVMAAVEVAGDDTATLSNYLEQLQTRSAA